MIVDRWWLIEPSDDFLEINQDDIEEIKFNFGIEKEDDDDKDEG